MAADDNKTDPIDPPERIDVTQAGAVSPAASVVAFDLHAGRDVIVAGGNVSITNPAAPLTAAELDRVLVAGTSPLPTKRGPAALLNARHEVVPFFEPGRAGVLAELRSWCDADAPVRARLLHGAGGLGKTRLFIEACARLRHEGWRAGFLPRGVDPAHVNALFAAAENHPTFAVIDYAESRSDLAAILGVAAGAARGDRGRLRVVLLGRAVGDWWTYLLECEGAVKDLLVEDDLLELRPLVVGGSEREAVFRQAAVRFAAVLGKTVPEAPPPALEDGLFDRVLYVHMAALGIVEGRNITAASLLDDTLDHEQRFWAGQFQPKSPLEERALVERIRRAVAALTLSGGAAVGEAEGLVARASGSADDTLPMFLRDLYPGASGGIGGLEPDLLGEAMVLRTLTKEGTRAGEYLDRVFDSAGERAIGNGFVVLGRLSEEHAEAEAWIVDGLPDPQFFNPHVVTSGLSTSGREVHQLEERQ